MHPLKNGKQVTVQIPMAIELRDALKLKAQYFGFSSIQDMVRFWALAQVEGRKIAWEDEDWEPIGLALPRLPNEKPGEPVKPPKSSPPRGYGWR